MDNNRKFVDILGVSQGEVFISKRELSKAGIHRPTQAEISGFQTGRADSVIAGGYADKDLGSIIMYGHEEEMEILVNM